MVVDLQGCEAFYCDLASLELHFFVTVSKGEIDKDVPQFLIHCCKSEIVFWDLHEQDDLFLDGGCISQYAFLINFSYLGALTA